MEHLNDLFADPNFRKKLLKRIAEGWSREKIEKMSTPEIFSRLNRLGIKTSKKQFLKASRHYESADDLSEEEWYAKYTLQPEGRYDEDFPWIAAIVLWKRLVPDRICFEQINDLMQDGYDYLDENRTPKACDAWWQTWEWIKEKVTPERNTLAAFDEAFRGAQSIFNWCSHFIIELHNAGLKDPQYFHMRICYVQEFLNTFTELSWLRQGNFLRAEAESYWLVGEIDKAESKFKALIEANPNWAWGYINWSDMYARTFYGTVDYDRAEEILQRALERPNLEEREMVLDRLERVRKRRSSS